MRRDLVDILRCPRTRQRLVLEVTQGDGNRIQTGWLATADGAHKYPIRNFIPRFVPESNYADNFGMQWNKFRRTQLDSYSGHPISAERFWQATGWRAEDLRGQWVLDVGCGAGRFAEVALGAGANLVAIDYSSAVDACRANLEEHPRLDVVQADIYALPFLAHSFQYVYSLGVLQHTPDVSRAFLALPPMLRPGGRLCVDFYEKSWKAWLHPKYCLRPITKRMNGARLFSALHSAVPTMLAISRTLGRVPGVGRVARRVVPVANYEGILPLNQEQLVEWALLDTFDWLAPAYDNPQTAQTVALWLQRARLEQIEVLKAKHLVGRGVAAHAPGH